MGSTIVPGVLQVGAAFPDPPFEFLADGEPAGFDIDLMQAVAAEAGLEWRLVRYTGDDFNGIFEGLNDGRWDCVASGTTITPARQEMADFCMPYVRSGQSLVCNIERTPQVRSIDDLGGLVIAVQHGNTSEPVVRRLKDEGKVADVRIYAYRDMPNMLDDLEAGRIGAVMKLAPVMRWFTRDRPALRVVQERITEETLGVCVRRGNVDLRAAIDEAQARLAADGRLATLVSKWLTA